MHLILQGIQNMMEIKEVLLPCFTSFLVKNLLHLKINLLQVVVLKMKLKKNQQLADELHKPIIKKKIKKKIIFIIQRQYLGC